MNVSMMMNPQNMYNVDINISSQYFDIPTFTSKFKNSKNPLILSINILSLQSKYNEFKSFILEITNCDIKIDVIAIQETWNIKYPELLDIPGFQRIIYCTRSNNANGGGVGYYIREGLSFKQITNLVDNHNNIFESISV
jgi:hypothetical protein